MAPYLDCDTTPPIKSRFVSGSLAVAKRRALALLESVEEGQIGIYDNSLGHGFKGYAIRYPGETPYFENVAPVAS